MIATRDAWYEQCGGAPPGNKLALERDQWQKPVDAGAISARGKRVRCACLCMRVCWGMLVCVAERKEVEGAWRDQWQELVRVGAISARGRRVRWSCAGGRVGMRQHGRREGTRHVW